MRKLALSIALGLSCAGLVSSGALAAPSLSVGLSGGQGRAPEVLPGDTYRQGIVVTAGDQDTDVLVEVLGYKQDPEKGVIPLTAAEDNGPMSARTFISPENTTVHLTAGETKKVDLDVSVPTDVGDGGRYALLRFSARANGGGAVGVVSAIVLPFRFTIKGSNLIHTGRIASLQVQVLERSKPLAAIVNYENTGNHHYNIKGQIRIKSLDGALVAASDFSAASPIPNSTAQISKDMYPTKTLQPGGYSAEVEVNLEDGTPIDTASTTFQIPVKYVAPHSPEATAASQNLPPGPGPEHSPTSNMPALVGLVCGAFLLGSLGTLLATRRRKAR